MERTAIGARGDFGIGGFGLCHGAFFGECDEEMQCRIEASNALNVHFRERDGGDFFCANVFGEFGDVGEGQFFKVDGWFADGRRVAVLRSFAPGLHNGILRQRIEDIGWSDTVLDVKGADGRVAVTLLIQRIQHHGNLIGRKGNTSQRRRLFDHFGRNFWKRWSGGGCGGRLRLRLGGDGIESTWQQGRSKSKLRTDSKKTATVKHDAELYHSRRKVYIP